MAKNRSAAKPSDGGVAERRDGPAGLSLGPRVKSLRRARGWTLDQLSQACGLSISALSKIENDQVSASFDTIVKISQAFGQPFEDLFRPRPQASSPAVSGRRTVTRAGSGLPFSTANYEYEVHSAELTHKGMIPLFMHIKARTLPPISEWSSHSGEEFIYITSGSVELHTEFYAPAALATGDSAYIDSAMRHAFISTGPDDATMLSICMTESLVFDDVVIGRRSPPGADEPADAAPRPQDAIERG